MAGVHSGPQSAFLLGGVRYEEYMYIQYKALTPPGVLLIICSCIVQLAVVRITFLIPKNRFRARLVFNAISYTYVPTKPRPKGNITAHRKVYPKHICILDRN
jgi:hypothetical protein